MRVSGSSSGPSERWRQAEEHCINLQCEVRLQQWRRRRGQCGVEWSEWIISLSLKAAVSVQSLSGNMVTEKMRDGRKLYFNVFAFACKSIAFPWETFQSLAKLLHSPEKNCSHSQNYCVPQRKIAVAHKTIAFPPEKNHKRFSLAKLLRFPEKNSVCLQNYCVLSQNYCLYLWN